jgi:hypothetical protein
MLFSLPGYDFYPACILHLIAEFVAGRRVLNMNMKQALRVKPGRDSGVGPARVLLAIEPDYLGLSIERDTNLGSHVLGLG